MLKKLIQALYYPAVLGTGFVLLLNKLVIQPAASVVVADVTNHFAVLLILFFSIAYLVNDSVPVDSYGVLPFVLDLAEIAMVFLCFFYLGFMQPDKPDAVNLSRFYFALAIVPCLQQCWNVAVGLTDRRRVLLSGAVLAFLLCGGLWGWRFQAFNVGAVPLLAAALFAYLRLLGRPGHSEAVLS